MPAHRQGIHLVVVLYTVHYSMPAHRQGVYYIVLLCIVYCNVEVIVCHARGTDLL